MGNCLGCSSLKGQRNLEDSVSFKISNWIDSSDFSSKPDLDVILPVPASPPKHVRRPVEVAQTQQQRSERLELEEGYLTAVENMDSEDERSTAVSINTSYETSDEQVEPTVTMDAPECSSIDNPDFNKKENLSSDDASSIEADEEQISQTNYESRPIRPMPTPVRENVLSPSIKLEQIVNDSGRVSHKRLMKYMQLREKRPINYNFAEVTQS